MYDGNQVLTFKNKIKAKDIGGIGKELTDRIGTGNYDNNRTKFNIIYKNFSTTLASEIYKTLNDNNISYNNNKKNVNILNGAIVTSGPEFFQTLGMKFVKSDRFYKMGNNKGDNIPIPDINDEKDIPDKLKKFFDDSYEFLCNYVGKENVIYAAVHFDEDTPHMHFYFIPVVNKVNKKVFEKDSNGNCIKKTIVDKNGKEKQVPIQKKDQNGKNMYELVKGNFLNCDEFWKSKGGKNSFRQVNDEFNKYITEKGFNLNRGNVGAGTKRKEKLQYEIECLEEQLKDIKKDIKFNELENITSNKIKDIELESILSPSKNPILGYKEKDINNLINYSKKIKKGYLIIENNNQKKDYEISVLKEEVNNLKTSKILKDENKLIKSQQDIIDKQDKTINNLSLELNNLKETFENYKNRIKKLLITLCKAISHLLGKHDIKDEDINFKEYELNSKLINQKFNKNKKIEKEL